MAQQTNTGYVTDGKHTYPYNLFLDEMIKAGKLQFCERPSVLGPAAAVPLRSPLTMGPEERMALAKRLNITLGDLSNMSPQELTEAEAALAKGEVPELAGFPVAAGE